MATGQSEFKVTYSTMGMAQAEEFHELFDAALKEIRNTLGRTYPNYIGGASLTGTQTTTNRSPTDIRTVLGYFAEAGADNVAGAIRAAKAAFPTWRDMGWQARITILRKAAGIISERKYELAAVMSLEAGKSRLESMGDVEESADMIRYYCQEMENANGYVRPMGRLTPNENVKSVLRPYGVWAVISPFNFPLALATGMSAGVLIAGNTAVYKPSHDVPWSGLLLYEIFTEAGVPAGVFNFVNTPGSIAGKVMVTSPDVDGFIFTGSKIVGMSIYHQFSKNYPKPCITEMGGKNPAIVTARADLEKAAEGIMRAAFGFGGQKCSACSRVYVQKEVERQFLELLVMKTKAINIGDPTQRDVFLGPLINETAYHNFQTYVETARKDGTILTGGRILTDEPFEHGYFVEPTLAVGLPKAHRFFYEELFVPLLVIAPVDSLDAAISLSNRAEYGLTAGIFSEDEEEIEHFFDNMESGVCYANRRSGATTGAWPGVQPFCGWKGSGSSGKGCCGPYYIQQFMREQSRTIMGNSSPDLLE